MELAMTELNKKIRLLFFFALGISIAFPLGLLGIIFGAVFGMIPLMVIGIVITVSGFYAMPILWVRYGERRGDRTLLFIIENERIYTVSELALQTGYKEDDVRNRIRRMIHGRSLVGYLFINDTLELNIPAPPPTKKCTGCGAVMKHDGVKYRCEYCLGESE